MENDINKRIAQEQAKIEVPSYQDVAFDGAWKSRSRYIWGLSAVGAIAGAAIGAAALVAPALFGGLSVGVPLIAKSMVAFSALGLSAGWSVGALAGFPAGAAASTAKELERRMLARDIEEKIRENPDATVVVGEQAIPKKTNETGISGYFNWKTALVLGAIGAIGGAIFAAAIGLGGPATLFAMPAMDFLLTTTNAAGVMVAPTTNAVAAYTVGLGAVAGAFFGTNIPRIGREAGDLMGGILSGQSIGAPWPDEANMPDLKPILSPKIIAEESKQPEQQSNFSAKLASKEFQNFSERVKAAPAGEAALSGRYN